MGLTEDQIANAGEVSALGELLVGRVGRVSLSVYESRHGPVNTHKPGSVNLVSKPASQGQ